MSWPEITACPAPGTIVRILAMSHMSYLDEHGLKDLPGGIFGEIFCRDREGGHIYVRTVPRALLDHPPYSMWEWDETFPFEFSNQPHVSGNVMRLQRPPEHIADAVRAFVALSCRTGNLPVVVEDGWLCEGA